MKLWAVVEDYDNGKDFVDEEHRDDESYDNQLVGLFESKSEAFNNLKYGVLNVWDEDNVSIFGKYVITYYCGNRTLHRRLVEVETGKMYPDVYSDSILCSRNK